jgi:catechol 2,3-dioxygenase-like lactoylglutathione lyase family enzyme
MIFGAHTILYSADADADRRFLREVLGFTAVDAGHGWLIFALPPGEAAVHPAGEGGRAELYLMSNDLPADMRALEAKGVKFSSTSDERWGSVTKFRLPGGGEIGLYQPRHVMAIPAP